MILNVGGSRRTCIRASSCDGPCAGPEKSRRADPAQPLLVDDLPESGEEDRSTVGRDA
jgi:hypothetical protein